MTEKSFWVTERNMLLPMGADPTYTTVSGFSGGSLMSDQLHVIYSETFKGAAVFSGASISALDVVDQAATEDAEFFAEHSINTTETYFE